jgi:hypothetical protein
MKPGRNNLFTIVAALGLLVAATDSLQASGGNPIPVTLNIKATAIAQSSTIPGPPIDKILTSTYKFTTKDLLNLIWYFYNAPANVAPSGTKLVLWYGDVYLVDGAGYILQDLTSDVVLYIHSNGGNLITQEQVNENTCQYSVAYSYMAELYFYDGSANGIISYGLEQDKISLAATDSHGKQKASDSMTLTGAGDALIYGAAAVVSGTMTGSGKITISSLCP